MSFKLDINPSPKQLEFFKANARHIGYGGSRGGGKSWAVRMKLVLLCLSYDNLNCLLLRRTLGELKKNHTFPLLKILHGIAKYHDDDKCFTFPNGSKLFLGYCEAEKDVLQFQGQEYDVIALEEATHFTESQMTFITTCNRSVRTDFKPRMYYSSNPGGVGHTWFKRLFIDRDYKNKEKAENYQMIFANVYDNKVLLDSNPEYLEILENLPDDLRRAHLDGDWDALAGQYFREFKRSIHVCKPFIIPKEWRKYRSMDYGLDMLAVYWYAIDPNENVYVYRELYQEGLIISEAARAINKANGEDEITATYAPPDMWNRRQDTGKSASQIFSEGGVHLYKSKNDRVTGWYALKEYLNPVKSRDEQTGKDIYNSKLKIFDNCNNLIRVLPMLQSDTANSNDVATQPHELTHAADSLRYFVIMRQLRTELKDPRIFGDFDSREPEGNEYSQYINY